MSKTDFQNAVKIGLIAGIVAVSVSAIGMVETFDERDIITDILTLGRCCFTARRSSPVILWWRRKKI